MAETRAVNPGNGRINSDSHKELRCVEESACCIAPAKLLSTLTALRCMLATWQLR